MRHVCYEHFLIDANNYCYQIKPEVKLNAILELREYSDMYYAEDNYTRIIMIGYVILINGVVVT